MVLACYRQCKYDHNMLLTLARTTGGDMIITWYDHSTGGDMIITWYYHATGGESIIIT